MIVIDEYLAVRVLSGVWPSSLPREDLALPASHHWRLLQALHRSRGGQLTSLLSGLTPSALDGVRYPHPEVLTILDPRPLLDKAARLTAQFGGSWLTGDTLAAGQVHGNRLYFGSQQNVGRPTITAAEHLGIEITVVE